MNEPTLTPRDALSGQKIALSVSESADLARLGLTELHCRLVVAEVAGVEPGVIEEARLTIQAGRPLLAAGGYGGAASAVAQRLRPQDFDDWAPSGYPLHAEDAEVTVALDALGDAYAATGATSVLDETLLRTLTISHRPADIASATVRLLSQVAPTNNLA